MSFHKKQMEKYATIGMEIANKFFETRGNNSEVHLDRNNLSALLAYAYELGYKQGKNDFVSSFKAEGE